MLFSVGYVLAEGKTVKQKVQKKCPVMGGTINTELYADFEGKRVYFCCAGCIPEFEKDPAQHIQKLENEGVMLEAASKAEPKNKSTPAASQGCEKSDSCGGCGDCDCF